MLCAYAVAVCVYCMMSHRHRATMLTERCGCSAARDSDGSDAAVMDIFYLTKQTEGFFFLSFGSLSDGSTAHPFTSVCLSQKSLQTAARRKRNQNNSTSLSALSVLTDENNTFGVYWISSWIFSSLKYICEKEQNEISKESILCHIYKHGILLYNIYNFLFVKFVSINYYSGLFNEEAHILTHTQSSSCL